jgi:hypothetical protein
VNIAHTDQNWSSYFDEVPSSKGTSSGETSKNSDQKPATAAREAKEASVSEDDFVPQCVLCMPIKNSKNDIIGVIQVCLYEQ